MNDTALSRHVATGTSTSNDAAWRYSELQLIFCTTTTAATTIAMRAEIKASRCYQATTYFAHDAHDLIPLRKILLYASGGQSLPNPSRHGYTGKCLKCPRPPPLPPRPHLEIALSVQVTRLLV